MVFLTLLAQCFLFICEGKRQRAACPPPDDKRMAVETSSFGGENEMLQSVEAQSRESWRGDKNVSIHANWCPDPPPGCYCLLSGEGIKGPFTRHEGFLFLPTRPLPVPLTPLSLPSGRLSYLIDAEMGNFPSRFIQKKKLLSL